MLAGDPRAIARAITLIEDESPAGAELVRGIFARTGRAYLIGVTGPPGAGKSTLVDKLTAAIRATGRTVGVVAVDPTSPFTGGAILGDRVRMQAHAGDAGVFIRSMATRGHLGGLAQATSEVALVFDAAGKDVVLIETVGVGQDEVDIVRTADISIVMIVPGSGDEVQALKAGIMEIADIFVVNKADREGADRSRRLDRDGAVAPDVRSRRVAAADPQDGGHERQGRRRAARGDRPVSRAVTIVEQGTRRRRARGMAPARAPGATVHAARRAPRAAGWRVRTGAGPNCRARGRSVFGRRRHPAPSGGRTREPREPAGPAEPT